MSGQYLMKCGHADNAVNSYGEPICAICAGFTEDAEIIDHEIEDPYEGLEDREASCSYCGSRTESSWNLPFFEYIPGRDTDSYYCGCRGWD